MFGDNLKKYRTEKGLSQNDLAEKLFVTRQCVSKWEKGVTQPDLQTLAQISSLLEVSVDELLSGNHQLNKQNSANINLLLLISDFLLAIFCLLSFLAVWKFMPNTIPAHWTGGIIDRFGSRNEILINMVTPTVFLALDILIYFALRRINDKRVLFITHGIIAVFQIAYLIFIIALYAKYLINVLSFITCLCAVLIMCISIAMHPKINKQNCILGFRTAETLKSKVVWNKTNSLACYLFTGCSLIIFIVNMLVIFDFSYLCFVAYIIITILIIIYSKKIKTEQ